MDFEMLGGIASGLRQGLDSFKEARKETKKDRADKEALDRVLQERAEDKQLDADKFAFDKEKFTQSKLQEQNQQRAGLIKDGFEPSIDEDGVLSGKFNKSFRKEKDPLVEALQNERLDKFAADKAKREHDATPLGRVNNLNATDKIRFDNARTSLNSVRKMGNALIGDNQNTFSAIGDNDFTASKTIASEALGRMQSGGAISIPEEQRFLKMLPTFLDSPKQRKSKLVLFEKEMQERLRTLGFDEGQLDGAGFTITKFDDKTQKGLLGTPGLIQEPSAPTVAYSRDDQTQAAKILAERRANKNRTVSR